MNVKVMSNGMPLLAWLYDVTLDSQGIRFVLFRLLTVYFLRFDNIKNVIEISGVSPGSWNSYNFKNRLGARSFQVEISRGWFARKILVTPKDPALFLDSLRSNGVSVE